MVGIPGKSKGCITCRRRKIRCDETKPDCNRCAKSGRECEGYESFPTFLNQTMHGPQKRFGLEEAKPRQTLNRGSPSTDVSRRSSSSSIRISRQASNTELFDTQLVSQFWQSYVPVEDSAQSESQCQWLQKSLDSQQPTIALRLSLKALAFTRLGWYQTDTTLRSRGRMMYGNALKELQKALWDEKLMWLDETLAAAHALSVYELYESTTGSIRGWNSHLTGMGLLIRLRGSHRYKSALGRAVIEAVRFNSMIQSMQYRKASFFLGDEWQSTKLGLGGNGVSHQRFIDHGFVIGAIQEEADQNGLLTGEMEPTMAAHVAKRLADLDKSLDNSYEILVQSSSPSLYWTNSHIASGSSTYHSTTAGESYIAGPLLSFSSLSRAVSANTYWSLKIIIAASARQITNATRQIPIPVSTYPSPPQLESHSQQQETHTTSAQGHVNSLLPHHSSGTHETGPDPYAQSQETSVPSSNVPLYYATLILRSMHYLLSPNQNMLGSQLSLFPLRVTLFLLQLFPMTENPLLSWCRNIYRIVDETKGIGYAKEISKLVGGHGACGNKCDADCETMPASNLSPMPSQGPYEVGVTGGVDDEEQEVGEWTCPNELLLKYSSSC